MCLPVLNLSVSYSVQQFNACSVHSSQDCELRTRRCATRGRSPHEVPAPKAPFAEIGPVKRRSPCQWFLLFMPDLTSTTNIWRSATSKQSTSIANMEKVPYQPLHASVRDILEPEYVTVHDEILQYVRPTESQEWSPVSRSKPSPTAHCTQKLVEVGRKYDKEVGNFQIRVFMPSETAPAEGWPCLVWYHGGGWVNGGLNSENGFLTHVCKCTITYPTVPTRD